MGGKSQVSLRSLVIPRGDNCAGRLSGLVEMVAATERERSSPLVSRLIGPLMVTRMTWSSANSGLAGSAKAAAVDATRAPSASSARFILPPLVTASRHIVRRQPVADDLQPSRLAVIIFRIC